jgi:hypothetical protein
VDAKQKILAKLHDVYNAGNLRILAGAGVSRESELPDWETLNYSLLKRYLSTTLSTIGSHHIVPGDSLADTLAQDIYGRLGRDAVAELVLKSSEPEEEFNERLAEALYEKHGLKRGIENLYFSDLQRQIAALTINPKSFFNGQRPCWGPPGRA